MTGQGVPVHRWWSGRMGPAEARHVLTVRGRGYEVGLAGWPGAGGFG